MAGVFGFNLGSAGPAPAVAIGGAVTALERRTGERWKDASYESLRSMGSILAQLQRFASDDEAEFPAAELERSKAILRLPSLFGGAKGLPGPDAAHRKIVEESEDFDDESFRAQPVPMINMTPNVAPNMAPDVQAKKAKVARAVLGLTSKFSVNEKLAVNYWLDAKVPENRQALPLVFGSSATRASDAAEQLYLMDRTHLVDVVTLLMKLREYDDSRDDMVPRLSRCKHAQVMAFTNDLLQQMPSIIQLLLDVLREDINRMSRSTFSSVSSHVQQLALAVFHSCYQLQCTPAEEEDLLRTIQEICRHIVRDESSDDDREQKGTQKGLQAALVVMQATYMHILNDPILLRPNPSEAKRRGNALVRNIDAQLKPFQHRHSDPDRRDEMGLFRNLDRNDEDYWRSSCLGANGLIYLIYARLLHFDASGPAPDEQRILSLFKEACDRRAYSYIRLCMLPVLQSQNVHDSANDTFSVITDVVKTFLLDLSEIFCEDSFSRHEGLLDKNATFPFFPLANEAKEAKGLRGRGSAKAESPTGQSDSFVDVVLLFSAFIKANPWFAWHYSSNNSPVRRFLDKVLLAAHHGKMRHPALRFMTALASAPTKVDGDSAPKKVFEILKRGNPSAAFRWVDFSGELEDLAQTHTKQEESTYEAAARFRAMGEFMHRGGAGGGGLGRFGGGYGGDVLPEMTEERESQVAAYADLYAAIASQFGLAHVEEAMSPGLVKAFFKLLSCPLSISTKGSIFRALAGYARNCSDTYFMHELWRSFIEAGFLPSSAEYLGAAAAGGAIGEGAYRVGLRVELEDTESRAGLFSITDGYLTLLEVLLSRGLPDQIQVPGSTGAGRGAFVVRKQDLLVHLEFVVEDILAEAEGRYFRDTQIDQQQPAVQKQSSAQKWRMYARAFKLLSTVLQHYRINLLSSQYSSEASARLLAYEDASSLLELQADFADDDAVLLQQQQQQQQYFPAATHAHYGTALQAYGSAAQSAGGAVAAAALATIERRVKSPGFVVMALLLSSSRNSLQDALMGLLRLSRFDQVRETDQMNKLRAALSAAGVMHEIRTTDQGNLVDVVGTESLDALGFEDGVSDSSYWHIKAVAAATGLLYECALREKVFMECVHGSPQISMARIRKAALTHLPVGVQSLSRVFARFRYSETRSESVLTHVISLLHFPCVKCPCIPSVPVMAACIMKSVAADLSTNEALLTVGVNEVEREQLVRECSHALLDPNHPKSDDDLPLGGLVFPPGIVLLGSDVLPDVFTETPHFRATAEAPHTERIVENVKAALRRAKMGYSVAQESFPSVRDALLDLLVSSLSPTEECFAHVLLGVSSLTRSPFFMDDPLRAGNDLPDPRAFPATCLEAVLLVLQDSVTLVLRRPEQAMLCFELVYRLCATPVTNLVTLSFLRRDKINFLPRHVRHCMTLLRLSDDEIIGRALADAAEAEVQADDWGERCAETLARVKYARLNCCAWLLKTCALEFRALSVADVAVPHLVDVLSRPLFESVAVSGSGSELVALVSMLLAAVDVPDDRFPQFSELMRRLVSQASTPFSVSRGGPVGSRAVRAQGFVVDKFLFHRLCALEGGADPHDPRYIDKAAYEGALEGVTYLNRYIKHATAAAHVCEGWNQCVGMALFCHKMDPRRITTSLLLPSLQVLNSHDKLETDMPELVSSAVFSMVSVLHVQASAAGTSLSSVLDTEQHRSLLHGLVSACVQGEHRAGATLRYRSFLVQSIGLLLTGLSGFASQAVVVSPTLRQPAVDDGLDVGSSGATLGGGGGGGSVGSAGGLVVAGVGSDATYRSQTVELLEHHVSALLDTVGMDVCSGPVFSRLAAAGTLQAILSVLGPAKADALPFALGGGERFKHVLGSHAFLQALQVLVQRGYLQQMLAVLGPITGTRLALGGRGRLVGSDSAADEGSEHLDENDERDLFLSTASLCVQISCAVEGVDALVQHGQLLQRILSISTFINPPPARDDIMRAAADAPSLEDWEDMLLVLLRLLRTLAATSPTRHVLEVCAAFLKKNNQSVTHLLRLKHKSLYGMALLEATVAIIALVAAAPNAPLHRNPHFSQGDVFEVLVQGQPLWLGGRVARDNRDGTLDVDLDDGQRGKRVQEASMRHRLSDPASSGILWDEALGRLAESFSSDI